MPELEPKHWVYGSAKDQRWTVCGLSIYYKEHERYTYKREDATCEACLEPTRTARPSFR